MGDVPRVPRRDRRQAADHGRDHAGAALRAPHLRDGGARRRGRPPDGRRAGRDVPPGAGERARRRFRRLVQPAAGASYEGRGDDPGHLRPLPGARGDRGRHERGRRRRVPVRRSVRAGVVARPRPQGRDHGDLPLGRGGAGDVDRTRSAALQGDPGVSADPWPRHDGADEPGGVASPLRPEPCLPGARRRPADAGTASNGCAIRRCGRRSSPAIGT